MDKTLIFIPFRKGSKGIPNKNIRELNGKPLFKHTTQESVFAKMMTERVYDVVLATDYEYETLNLTWEKDVVYYWNRRGFPSTRDKASTESAIQEYLDHNDHSKFENIMLVQVTNPFLTSRQIIQALYSYDSKGSMMSVVPFNRYIWDEEKNLAVYDKRYRRQDMKNLYLENGSFYLFNKTEFLDTGSRMNWPVQYFEMPIESAFEIDEEEDWRVVEKLLKK